MRTTVDLPDRLFRDLKAAAAQRGVSLKSLIQQAVQVELQKPKTASQRRVKFPILQSKAPGTLKLTNADIEELLT